MGCEALLNNLPVINLPTVKGRRKMKQLLCVLMCVIFLSGVGYTFQDAKGTAKKASAKETVDCSQLNDAQLTARVKEKFANTKGLKDANLTVVSQNGALILTGKVQKGTMKGLATRQAKRIPCVKEVDNQIIVESTTTKASK
jgi:hypothetical protein